MPLMTKMFLLAFAGALGTLARYGLGNLVPRFIQGPFPAGVMVVNLSGSFLAGLLWSLVTHRIPLDHDARTILFVGFLGAFTTFSAVMLDTGLMLRAVDWSAATTNLLLHNILGLIALFLGLALGRVV